MTAVHVRRTGRRLEQISGLFQLVDPKLGVDTANTFSLANRCSSRGTALEVPGVGWDRLFSFMMSV